jgi:peptidoglycan-associated lipoprotein
MRSVLLIALVVCIALMIGCHPKKMRPMDEEQQQEEQARRAAEEQARREREEREAREREQAVTPITVEEEEEITLNSIYFDYDRYNLSKESTDILSRNAKIMMDNPGLTILIEGHCDERGTEEYNLALGEKRAIAARDFLVRFGIAKPRISVISYGEERPLDPGHDEEAWEKNRRAGFVIR